MTLWPRSWVRSVWVDHSTTY